MSLAALFSWLITVSGGLYLLIIWLIEYDHEFQSGAATRLPVPVISTHALLAVTGLGLWGYYLFSDSTRLAWAAVAILAVVATLGLVMAARWIVVYRTHRAPRVAVAAAGAHSATVSFFNPAATDRFGAGRAASPQVAGPPERHFPLPVVIAHGVFAVVTIVLVVLTALDVHGS
ncbi:MAG: hypothetical protein ACRDND_01725 [Streptosporangiaceae bacterium]